MSAFFSFANPKNERISRPDLQAMLDAFQSKGGTPRRFERGVSGDWHNVCVMMRDLGYHLSTRRGVYTFHRLGSPAGAKLRKDQIWNAIDEVLISHGRQPFLRRVEHV